MFVFDTHCDTLTTARAARQGIADSRTELSLARPMGDSWCQCFAIWLSDRIHGQQAIDFYRRHQRYFAEQLATHPTVAEQARTAADIERITASGRVAAVLTVENGSALAGDIARVRTLADDGVRMMTLTWNKANELAGGHQEGGGFTDFGRAAVAELERYGIIADVSHLGEESFWELASFARRPFAASHSNSRAVHDHRRNLTDDQLRAIADCGGIVAVTYHQPFVGDGDVTPDDLLRHLEHIVTVGGEQLVALGSDFDGGEPPAWLCHSEDVVSLTERLTANFGIDLATAIAGGNALNFWKRYEKTAI